MQDSFEDKQEEEASSISRIVHFVRFDMKEADSLGQDCTLGQVGSLDSVGSSGQAVQVFFEPSIDLKDS